MLTNELIVTRNDKAGKCCVCDTYIPAGYGKKITQGSQSCIAHNGDCPPMALMRFDAICNETSVGRNSDFDREGWSEQDWRDACNPNEGFK